MSGVGQAVFMNQRSFGLIIGQAYEGGFFAGQISTTGNGVATHNLVVGPKSTAQNDSRQYKNANTSVGSGGAGSYIDGPQNTANMVANGNSTVYPAAHFCNNLSTGGQTDWYMPAWNELEVCYFNLKPTTTSNNTSYGTNSDAVPARASNYTSGNPAQTSAAAFQFGGSEAFDPNTYWTSTDNAYTSAIMVAFGSGVQIGPYKTNYYRVRAVRRVAV